MSVVCTLPALWHPLQEPEETNTRGERNPEWFSDPRGRESVNLGCVNAAERPRTSLWEIHEGGPRRNPAEFIYKNLCILPRRNVSHLQSALHQMQCTRRGVFRCSAFERIGFDAFDASAVLCSPLPHRQNVSL